MKTVTEFTNIEVKQAFSMRQSLLQNFRPEKKAVPAPTPAPSAEAVEAATATEISPAEPATQSQETSPPLETAPVEPVAQTETVSEPKIKTPEELLVIRQEERRIEWEEKLNQIKEPFLAQIKEKFKWSDERAAHAFSAVDIVSENNLVDLRIIRILKTDKEAEALPNHGKKVGDLIYVTEYYPRPGQEQKSDRSQDKNKRGRGGKSFGNNKGGQNFGKSAFAPKGPGGPKGPGAPKTPGAPKSNKA